jgi:pyochelin synthetase
MPDVQVQVIAEEICIDSPFRSHGYLNNPAENAARFVRGPSGQVLFRTGDLGRFGPDGLLEYRGRADQQVKIVGVRVQPAEVAAVLASHPHVAAARVLATRDSRGQTVLHGYYIPATSQVAAAQLRAYLAERLPAVMVPARLTSVEGFPTTPNGKLDAKTLSSAAQQATPDRPDHRDDVPI